MPAPLLQRRPDVGDRAAGALLGLALGALRSRPAPAQDPRPRLARRVALAEARALEGAGAPDPGDLPEVADGAGPVAWSVPVAMLVLGGLPGERVDARRVRELLALAGDDGRLAPRLVPWAVSLDRAVRGEQPAPAPARGWDAGPLAGALAGARSGASAVPFASRRALDARGGVRSGGLLRLGLTMAGGDAGADEAWPLAPMLAGARAGQASELCELPGDPGVLLGNQASLTTALGQVEAVVSLSRVAPGVVPAGTEHHEVLLVDRADAGANPHLAFVLADTAEAIATLRAEGRRVLLHCRAGRSRTPTVAAAHLARRDGLSGPEAFARVTARLAHPDPHNRAFQRALAAIAPAGAAVAERGGLRD